LVTSNNKTKIINGELSLGRYFMNDDILEKEILNKEIAEQKKREIIIKKINENRQDYEEKLKEELKKYNEK
jgi:hypothetical protein